MIKKHLVKIIDGMTGQPKVLHIIDGICQRCEKAEGVMIGDRVLCESCFSELIK